MKAVYKYPLGLGYTTVKMSAGAKVISAQFQHGLVGIAQLWALVDTDPQEFENRIFVVLGTGMEVPSEVADRLRHVETTQMGEYVWHVFEQVEA